MSKSNIEWTNDTWNPVVGCTKVSPGCRECYAEKMAVRLRAMALADLKEGRDPGRKAAYIDAVDDRGRWTGKLIQVPEALGDPLGWRKPRRVFVNSMSDLFHESINERFIDDVFASMALAPRHTFQILTKRPQRMLDWFRRTSTGATREQMVCSATRQLEWPGWPLRNVWLGVSVEDQQRADERIPLLLQTSATVRFLSCEPLLGPIELMLRTCAECGRGVVDTPRQPAYQCPHCQIATEATRGIDWVIVGGESGPNARPCNVDWIRSIVEQCRETDVACFVKQVGSRPTGAWPANRLRHDHPAMRDVVVLNNRKGGDPVEWPDDLRVQEYPA